MPSKDFLRLNPGYRKSTLSRAIKASGKKKRDNKDKKGLFLAAWRLLAPGSPEPVTEYRFVSAALPRKGIRAALKELGLQDWRFDYVFLEHRLAIEIDGGQYIIAKGRGGRVSVGGRHNTDSDRWKRNVAAMMGWRVMIFSPQMLEREQERCIREVMGALDYLPPELVKEN